MPVATNDCTSCPKQPKHIRNTVAAAATGGVLLGGTNLATQVTAIKIKPDTFEKMYNQIPKSYKKYIKDIRTAKKIDWKGTGQFTAAGAAAGVGLYAAYAVTKAGLKKMFAKPADFRHYH